MDRIILEVTKHHSAVYWNEVTCRFTARPGKIKYDETAITHSYSFCHTANDYALEITEIADDTVTFVVPARYCKDGRGTTGTIHRGEAKEYVNTYKDSTRIDGDDYNYEVENRLAVKWGT